MDNTVKDWFKDVYNKAKTMLKESDNQRKDKPINNNKLTSILKIDNQYYNDITEFEDDLVELGFGNYEDQCFDFYDCSVLFLRVYVGEVLTLLQMKYLRSRGISLAFLEYVDGSKKLYDLHKELEKKYE